MATIGVLGIDAAWSPRNSSGVCLISKQGNRWGLVRLAAAVSDFTDRTSNSFPRRTEGARIEAHVLLGACQELGVDVRVVAIDMPLSRLPITGRRVSDDCISRQFGAKKASTHSPTTHRPGQYSTEIRDEFMQGGFDLVTDQRSDRSLIEVYPHTAILSLIPGLEERLKCKATKTRTYWPGDSQDIRKGKLRVEQDRLLSALKQQIGGLDLVLPQADTSFSALKPVEDALDAIVCAWVAAKFYEGHAIPYGDSVSAIWNPR